MARNSLWLTLAGIPQKPQEGPQQPRLAPELGALDSNSPASHQNDAWAARAAEIQASMGHWIDNSPGGRQQQALRDMPAYEKAAHWGNIGLGIAAGAGFGGQQQSLAQSHEQNLARNSPAFQQYLSESPGNPHIGGVTSNHALTAQQDWLRQQAQTLQPYTQDSWVRAAVPEASPSGGAISNRPTTRTPHTDHQALLAAAIRMGIIPDRQAAGRDFAGTPPSDFAFPNFPYGAGPHHEAAAPPMPGAFDRGALQAQEQDARFDIPGMRTTDERNPTPELITNPYRDYNVSSINRLGRREDSEGRRILADLSVTKFLNQYKPNTGIVNRDDMRQAIWDQIPGSLPASERGGSRDEPGLPTARDSRSPHEQEGFGWERAGDIPGPGALEFGDVYEMAPDKRTGIEWPTRRAASLLGGGINEHTTEAVGSSEVPALTGSWATSSSGKRYDKSIRPIFSQSTTHARPKQLMSDPDDTYETHEPRPATIDGARYIDREFVRPSQLEGKKLLNLEQPLPGPIAAQALERFKNSPAAATALKQLGSDPKRLTALLHQHRLGANSAIIGALRSGTFPIDAPARFNIDLLNALSPGQQLGHKFLLQQGYQGGTGNLARYSLPKVPRMARAGQTNRHYLRLWDTPPQP